ncbi:MAG: PIN domain-containing protein [Defluviitaleaceae bacterium]|nr:PIN domain-containing protein [Defluviitaleaceae bacterium]MCL2273701.1 PIN domain-containing protein [Defluviitaleaceae bacterium]
MILVDTSVIIDTLKNITNEKVRILKQVIGEGKTFSISSYTYLEVLQGAKTELEFNHLNEVLLSNVIFTLPGTLDTFVKTAKMVYTLRRQGITPRNTIDMLIALTAIENNIPLLHNDKDFDNMASIIGLKIVE